MKYVMIDRKRYRLHSAEGTEVERLRQRLDDLEEEVRQQRFEAWEQKMEACLWKNDLIDLTRGLTPDTVHIVRTMLREKRRLHAKHFSPDGRWAPPTRMSVRKVVDSITSPAELLHWLFVQADIVLCHETEEYLRELSVVIHGLREEVLRSKPIKNPTDENPHSV